jgi:hypothetical protein
VAAVVAGLDRLGVGNTSLDAVAGRITGKIALLAAGAIVVFAIACSPAAAAPRSGFCGSGRTIQSFGGHHRQGFAAHLVAAPGAVRAGAFSTFRVVNEGSDELAEISERVQRWTGTSWIRMPEPRLSFGAIAFLAPRSVSGCSGPLTGKGWAAGKYRFLLEVEALEKSSEPSRPKKHWLGAGFLLRRAVRSRIAR